MTKPLIFRGCATALITPFQKDHPDRIDSAALHALIHQQVTADIDALVVAGTTGEASALSPEEHRYLITESKKKWQGRLHPRHIFSFHRFSSPV